MTAAILAARPTGQRCSAADRHKAKKVDVIVVYKVDRLTRSLADFAKLVELFDSHGVSFVSVTQQFNTTTSMGRLTLNVLLSFAQFRARGHFRTHPGQDRRFQAERDLGRGMVPWIPGQKPQSGGYQVRRIVRTIFKRYLELGSLNR